MRILNSLTEINRAYRSVIANVGGA